MPDQAVVNEVIRQKNSLRIDDHEPTLEEMAKAYVDTLYLPANGHGQHVHPRYGRSDYIMRRMWARFGKEPANKAIDAEFVARKLKSPQLSI